MTSGIATRGNLNSVATPEQTLRATQNAIEQIDGIRQDLAQLYARLPTDGSVHPDAEFEVGESLQAVRKAYTRLLKARGVLAQDTLPFT